jgi:ribosome-associated heat shock protein Hsp15
MTQPSDRLAASLRLDKWLWHARFARTRSLASKLCAAGCVTVGGTLALKPHQPVRVGDAVTVLRGHLRRSVTVLALGDRRGPSAEARRLYLEPEPPMIEREPDSPWTPLLDAALDVAED